MQGGKIMTVLLALIALGAAGLGWFVTALAISSLSAADGGSSVEQVTQWAWVAPTGIITALVSAAVALNGWRWTDRLPRTSGITVTAGLCGVTFGALLATVFAPSPFSLIIGGAMTLVLAIFAAFSIRKTVRETGAHLKDVERIADLRRHGTCVRADVEKADFQNAWVAGDPEFVVTAAFDAPSGRRRVTQKLRITPSGAPFVGGTVLIWFHDDSDGIHMAEDGNSPHPNGAQYAPPPA